jgi:hypothetical protein
MGKQGKAGFDNRGRAGIVGATALATLAAAALAQQPFQAPVLVAAGSKGAIAAAVDCNRDGSPDVLSPGTTGALGGFAVPVAGGISAPCVLVTALDERGRALRADVEGPLLPISPDDGVHGTAALATGDLDGDGRGDLVVVGLDGAMEWRSNRGATTLGGSDFVAIGSLGDLAWLGEAAPPHAWYRLPVARVVDAEGDGDADILLAGTVHERGTNLPLASFLMLHRNAGGGAFTTLRRKFAGNVVDATFADLDRDGDHDQIVVLVELVGNQAFGNEIRHFGFAGSALLPIGNALPLGPGRATALALADVDGDQLNDYVVATNDWSPNGPIGSLAWHGGNGQGQFTGSTWGAIALPYNGTGLGAAIVALLAGDWNGDGHDDLAAVRAFVTGQATPAGLVATTAPSELLTVCGPALVYAEATATPLPGAHDALTLAAPPSMMLSLDLSPALLRTLDLGADGAPDLLVLGLDAATSDGAMATLANAAPHAQGAPWLVALGAGTGGDPAFPARLGFDGGAPRLGNGAFRCTLQNVQGGCLAGLVWGWTGYADMFPLHGFMMHVLPSEFGIASLTSGNAAGKGFATFALPIPNNPALVGDMGTFQYVYYDHVAGAFGGSQGANLWIGQ